jgi:hypothetical protein
VTEELERLRVLERILRIIAKTYDVDGEFKPCFFSNLGEVEDQSSNDASDKFTGRYRNKIFQTDKT